MKSKIQKGFTLIELVIVIVIISVMAAMFLPKVQDLKGTAQTATNKGSTKAIKSAWNMLYGLNQSEPTLSALQGAIDPNPTLASDSSGVCVSSGFVVKTYTDSAMTTATSAGMNTVKGIATAPTATTTTICP